MIRRFKEEDLDSVAQIWLTTNISAHPFIDSTYYENQYDMVKEMLRSAEIYVFEETEILGFIGLDGNYIAGIFIEENSQSKGIGKALIDYVKAIKQTLSLSVYAENNRAINFYKKAGFTITKEGFDEETQEKEYTMIYP